MAADYETVLRQQNQRDHEDASRPVGGLRKAQDAIEVCTTGLSLDAVVDKLLKLVRQRLAKCAELGTQQ
ncbi:MAG: (d)CMP kinase [Pirellulaceae bacterium]